MTYSGLFLGGESECGIVPKLLKVIDVPGE